MPKPTKGARLGKSPAHERLMLANLATALFEHRRITTTEAKARRLRPFAERLVTKAKRGDLHARRQVQAVIRDQSVIHQLFTEVGPSFAARPGGYTRITKIGPRKGDNAPMAVIELVEPMPEGATTGPAAGPAPETVSAAPAEPAADTATEEPAAASTEEATSESPEADDAVAEDPVAEDAVAEDAVAEDTEDSTEGESKS